MFCKNCGTEVKDKFCPNCGAEVKSDESTFGQADTGGMQQSGQPSVSISKIEPKQLYKILEGAGAVVVLFGCILPLYSVSLFGTTISTNYFKGDGFLVLVLLVVALILSFKRMHKRALIPAALAFVCFVYDAANVSKTLEGLSTYGAGLYFIIIGFIILAAGLFVAIKNKL